MIRWIFPIIHFLERLFSFLEPADYIRRIHYFWYFMRATVHTCQFPQRLGKRDGIRNHPCPQPADANKNGEEGWFYNFWAWSGSDAAAKLPSPTRNVDRFRPSSLHISFSDHFPRSIFLSVAALALLNTGPWDLSSFCSSNFACAKLLRLFGFMNCFDIKNKKAVLGMK